MTHHFPKDSVIRRVNLEPAIMFGAGRALLLQLAHPAVAQGVEDHSEFKRNPFSRLVGTLEATYAVVYGSTALAEGVGRRLRFVHDFIVGADYRANDTDNLLWVHATLADTALRCYEDLVGPLPAAEAETYYREMMRVAEVFGVPLDEQPADLAAFRAYVDATVAGLRITDVGKDLISFILDPELPLGLHRPLGPVLRVQRAVTLGSLPAPIRDQLDVPWTAAEQADHDRIVRRVRSVFRVVPRPLRTAGPRLSGLALLQLARRDVARFDAKVAARAAAAAASPAPSAGEAVAS